MPSTRLKIIANICRIFAGVVFAFSGFVKAVDPWGTALKVNEYLSIYGFEELQPASMIFSMKFTMQLPKQVPPFSMLRRSVDLSAK